MKTERELFLCELEGRGFIFKNKTWIYGMGDVGGRFDDDQLNMVWEMWQASALREGYKLVPLEPSEEMIKHMTNTPIDVNLLCDNADIFLNEDEALIAYKTAIGE